MFNKISAEEEIFSSMETTLAKNQVEHLHGFNKLAHAADLLNTAATIFDQAGMTEEAFNITQILEGLTKGL